MRWKLPRLDRGTVAVIAVAIVFGIAYSALVTVAQDYYASTSPDRSVFNNAPNGLSVWYRYLQALGTEPQTLQTFDTLPPKDAVLVIAGPFQADATPADAKKLSDWVRDGGRLVLVGTEAGVLVDDLGLGVSPSSVEANGEAGLVPRLPTALTSGVHTVEPGIDRLLASGPEWITHFGDTAGQLLISGVIGSGSVTWLAGPYPVSNTGIGRADNAELAVRLAGAGRIPAYFDEFHHGYVQGGGIWDRMSTGGRSAVVLLLLGVAVLVAAGARRLGPAVAPFEEPAARGAGYIGSLAELYRKAGAHADALASLEDGLRRALSRRHGTLEIGLARRPAAREALERSAALRGATGRMTREEFLAAARGLRKQRREVEGLDG